MNVPALKISFSEEERKWILKEIEQCLIKGELCQANHVMELEKQFASYVGVKHAIAVNSGSSAIEIIMRALNIEQKEVLVPTNTFIATAAGVLFAGGKVRLVDTGTNSLSVSLEELKKRVTKNTVGVIVVHIGGFIIPEIQEIRKWCDQQGLWLFEDAAHAHGSLLNGGFAGSFGIAGSYSFFATKVMTSGEGGIIVTNDDNLAENVRLYRNHGKTKPWESYHILLGSNWRMSEITATIARAQLSRLDDIIKQRDALASQYTAIFRKLSPDLELIVPQSTNNWYKYVVLLPKKIDRELVKQKMKENGVNLQGEVYGIPLHKQPVFKEYSIGDKFPNAEDICSRHICLPVYPSLTPEQVEYVAKQLVDVINQLK